MRVLVTRPLEDVGSLVAALEARGHEAMVEPLLSIERRPDVTLPLPLDGVQALLFTSANGVRAFADLAPERDLPVFAVGDASATAAREAGFETVESAGGDVTDLARLVGERLDADKGALFHPAASQLAGDLQGALEDAGFTVRRAALYEAQPAVELSPALRRAMADGDLDAAIFFSPRTARTFVALVERAGQSAACARLQAICLSEAVATRLAPLKWARVRVAARPEQAAVLARLDEAAGDLGTGAANLATHPSDTQMHAPNVIAAFGGIRPMASKLGVAVSTVQGWRERGSIPSARHAQIQAAAKEHSVQLNRQESAADDRISAPPAGAPAASAAPAVSKEATIPPRESQAQPTPPPAAPPSAASVSTGSPKIRFFGAFALGVIAVVAGAGLAIVGRDVWLADPLPTVADTPVAITENTAAVASLEQRLLAVESAARDRPVAVEAGESEAAQAAMTRLEDELSAVQNRLDGLAEDVVAAASAPDADTAMQTAAWGDVREQVQALAGRIDTLDERLSGLQNQLETMTVADGGGQGQTAGAAALSLAVSQLRYAVRGSAPFAVELQAVLDLVSSPAFANGSDFVDALTPLVPYAETGVPPLAKLKADFSSVARRVVSQRPGADDDDWLAGIKRRVSGLISVRPIGSVAGDDPAAVAARAESALADDDLAGAVGELSALQGAAAEAAGDWLAAAEARLMVHTALNQLSRGLIARLNPGVE